MKRPDWRLRWKQRLRDALSSLFFFWIPRRVPPLRSPLGINFVGYARAELGLGVAMRSMTLAARKAGLPFVVRDFEPGIESRQTDDSMQAFLSPHCVHDINCICINPDLFHRLPRWLRFREWTRQYNIAYWFWELPQFPEAWRYATHAVDEIWVNTEYVAQAMRQAHSNVVKIPFAVEFEVPGPELGRTYFDLPEKPFLFLFSYDFNSIAARKNPEAVMAAFECAFAHQSDDVALVIKAINGDRNPDALLRVRRRVDRDRRMILMDRYLSASAMRGLLQTADAYVSLHRAEGLGLGMAESMFLGKPVIATAYSGNMEFMNNENACLIPYRLVPVGEGEYFHGSGQSWAEPDLDAAAEAMRRVCRDTQYRQQLGRHAAAYMRERHSFAVVGQAMSERLATIAGQRRH